MFLRVAWRLRVAEEARLKQEASLRQGDEEHAHSREKAVPRSERSTVEVNALGVNVSRVGEISNRRRVSRA